MTMAMLQIRQVGCVRCMFWPDSRFLGRLLVSMLHVQLRLLGQWQWRMSNGQLQKLADTPAGAVRPMAVSQSILECHIGPPEHAPENGKGCLTILTENMIELETSLVMMAGTKASFLGIGLMCSLTS